MTEHIDFAFLDSGTGGIPYMLELKKKCPGRRCVYLGDTEHFPYGEKSAGEITDCASKAVESIVRKWNPRTVVIACNTISVTSLADLRRRFPELPIVGTVPAVRLAAKVSVNRKIGLLATNATVNHPYNRKLISDFASDCEVFLRGDPELIEFVEHRLFTASESERLDAVRPAVEYFKKCGCDTVILGCTHFTHIAADIQKCAGQGMRVVDSRDGVANQALRVEPLFDEADSGRGGSDSGGGVTDSGLLLPPDMSFFVTGECSETEEAEYESLCRRNSIPWGGRL